MVTRVLMTLRPRGWGGAGHPHRVIATARHAYPVSSGLCAGGLILKSEGSEIAKRKFSYWFKPLGFSDQDLMLQKHCSRRSLRGLIWPASNRLQIDLCSRCLFIIYGADRKAEPSVPPGISISYPSHSLLGHFMKSFIIRRAITQQSLEQSPASFSLPLELPHWSSEAVLIWKILAFLALISILSCPVNCSIIIPHVCLAFLCRAVCWDSSSGIKGVWWGSSFKCGPRSATSGYSWGTHSKYRVSGLTPAIDPGGADAC